MGTIGGVRAGELTERANKSGLLPSMGSVGDAYDNAVIESFWGQRPERVPQPQALVYPGRTGQRNVRVLEIFHNRRRRHSALGMLTPTEYEKLTNTRIHVA